MKYNSNLVTADKEPVNWVGPTANLASPLPDNDEVVIWYSPPLVGAAKPLLP